MKKNMRDRNKNKINGAPDFFLYRGDKMSGKERNSFERELQRDPFAEEASEGFSEITPEEALQDISSLQKQLKQRTEKRQKLILLRLAASVAVLMIVASIFIIIERKSTPERIASNIERTESMDLPESEPVAELPDKKEPSVPAVINQEKKAEIPPVEQKNQEPLILSENVGVAANQKSDSMKDMDSEVADKFEQPEKMAVITPAPARSMKSSGYKEIELKADTPVVITLDPDLAALNETVVTAYGISREKSEMEDAQIAYVAPQPSVGKSEFDKYIRENIQWPDTISSGRKIVVVVSFSVHTDGRIDSIMIIKSPGKLFSEEAIRLLRSGPAWQPARENGTNIEDKVKLRIVFKQD
ncbi:MAG: energy transducer TonB [Bacteroidales bacterium]|nr:energy transducer TonB [Bacteroidales bacterium]